MMCKYRGIYILFVLPLLIAPEALTDWYPNITMIKASCKSITVKAECPYLTKTKNIEFQLYDVRDKTKDGPLNSKKCDEQKIVQVEFDIDCKSLYRVNVSMSIDSVSMECDKFCATQHSSPTWLLGDVWCRSPNRSVIEECHFDQYTTDTNGCAASSKRCGTFITESPIVTKAPTWSTRIELVNASCDRIIVEATCPHWKTDKHVQMKLSSLINSSDSIQLNLTKSCKNGVSRVVRGEFLIKCKSLYQINVSLVIGNDVENCDRLCSMTHNSSAWVLGEHPCTGITDSMLSGKYNSYVNTCVRSRSNWTGSSRTVYIAVGIVLSLIVVIVIIGVGLFIRKGFTSRNFDDRHTFNVLTNKEFI